MIKVFFINLFSVMALAVEALSFSESPNTERLTQKTVSGAEFRRVTNEELEAAGVKDPKKFGEAWEDPFHTIWSDIQTKQDGSPMYLNHSDAEAFCIEQGASLPTGWPEERKDLGDDLPTILPALFARKPNFPNAESDFVRLRKYLGAEYAADFDTPKKYSAQILPNLTTTNERREIISRWHWSKSVYPDFSSYAFVFGGKDGYIDAELRSFRFVSFRCVVRASRLGG